MKLGKLTKAGILVAGYGAGQAAYNAVKGMKIKKNVAEEESVDKKVVADAAKAALNGVMGVVMMATGATIIKAGLEGKNEMVGVVVLREENNIDDMLNDELEDSLDNNEELNEAEIEIEVEEIN